MNGFEIPVNLVRSTWKKGISHFDNWIEKTRQKLHKPVDIIKWTACKIQEGNFPRTSTSKSKFPAKTIFTIISKTIDPTLHSVAKQRVIHILWKSLACVLRLLLQNLHYFELCGIGFFSYIFTNEAFMTLLLLPVLPYFSQLYLIKMHISWNISNLRKVSSLQMHWGTCFHLV